MASLLGLENKICYGTFNNICERIINYDINIRDAVELKFKGHTYSPKIN
jgi:hypothetical protein